MIPEIPLKRAVSLINRRGHRDPNLPFVGLEHIKGWTGKINLDANTEAEGTVGFFEPGDVLFGKLRPYLAKVALPNFSGNCSTEALVLRPNKKHEPRFIRYALSTPETIDRINGTTFGAKMPRASWEDIGREKIPAPDLETQRAIADFLDYETDRIDALVEKKLQLVSALKAKIHQFADLLVTGQDDPSRKMQSAHQDWLSEIPSNWSMKRGKYLFREMSRPPLLEDDVITAFRDGQVCLRSRRRSEGYTFAEKEVGYQRIHKGDLVIHTMDAFAGAIGLSEDYGKATGEYAVCTPKSDQINSEYFVHVLRCMARRDYIVILCPSVRQRAPRFRFVRFAPVAMPVPPKVEQDEIVKRINDNTARLTKVAEKTTISIDGLQELRASLIAAAVKGQINPASYRRHGTTDRALDQIAEEMAP